MRAALRYGVALAIAALAPACGLFGGGSDGGARDLAGAGEDLATGPGGDMAGGVPDMAVPPDAVEIRWELKTAQITGGTNNGFSLACDKAPATMLRFTATNTNTKMARTTDVPCPANAADGMAVLGLPDTQGPFILTGVAVGLDKSVGEKIRYSLPPMGQTTIRIYAEGCDAQACM